MSQTKLFPESMNAPYRPVGYISLQEITKFEPHFDSDGFMAPKKLKQVAED